MDWESVAAGLLHDTVEDTNVVTFERIEEEFGATVRRIVEGETKVLYMFMDANFGNLFFSILWTNSRLHWLSIGFILLSFMIRYLNWEN